MRGSFTPNGTAGISAGHILHLAATPVFTLMAALNTGGQPMICSMEGGSMLGGMALMYLLMAIVHLGPWLDLLRRQVRP